MPDTLDPIMQAAERLNKVEAGLNDAEARKLYDFWPAKGTPNWVVAAITADRYATDKFLRHRILPKGKRPVAEDCDSFSAGDTAWSFHDDGTIYSVEVVETRDGNCVQCPQWGLRWEDQLYPSEADARLALHWEKFDQLTAVAQ